VKSSRRDRLIASTPRVGQYFWVDFPHDAYKPEFTGEHPGIVIRAARHLEDACIIVPVTSSPWDNAKHMHRLTRNPNPRGHAEGVVAWAVCDHLYTVHAARLRPVTDLRRRPIYPKVAPDDLQAVFAAIRKALHHVFETPPEGEPVAAASRPGTQTLPPRR
jgi:uncharacterized protein YifN (PemK superfamily)